MSNPTVVFCIFSYVGDTAMVAITAKYLATLVGPKCVYVFDDAGAPMAASDVENLRKYAEYRVTSFPRNGNLNGEDCITGMHAEMHKAAEETGAQWICKLDSDTVVTAQFIKDLQHAAEDKFQVVGFVSSFDRLPWRAYGCCYAYLAEIAPLFRANLSSWFSHGLSHNKVFCPRLEEDSVFSSVVTAAGFNLLFLDAGKGPFEYFLQPWDYSDAEFIRPHARAITTGNIHILPKYAAVPRQSRRVFELRVLEEISEHLLKNA